MRHLLVIAAAAGASLTSAALAQPAAAAAAVGLEAPLVNLLGTKFENRACLDPATQKALGGVFAPVCTGAVTITNDSAGRPFKFVLGVDTLRTLPVGNGPLFDPAANPGVCQLADPLDPTLYGCVIGPATAPVICSVDVSGAAGVGQFGATLLEAACNLKQAVKFSATPKAALAPPAVPNIGVATSTECILDPSNRAPRLDTAIGEPVNVCDAGVVVKKQGAAVLAKYPLTKIAPGWKLWVKQGTKTTSWTWANPVLP